MSAELFFRERRTSARRRVREPVLHAQPGEVDEYRAPGEQPPKYVTLPTIAGQTYAWEYTHAWSAGRLLVDGAPR